MGDGPRVEEDDLDIEDDEDHRHQEEPHRESLRSLSAGDDPALVGGGLAVVRPAGGQQPRYHNAEGGEQERQGQEEDDGQVLAEHVTHPQLGLLSGCQPRDQVFAVSNSSRRAINSLSRTWSQ